MPLSQRRLKELGKVTDEPNAGRNGNTWVVKGGDNIANIAEQVYGNERMMAEIIRLNGGVKTIRPGMVLKLPNKKRNEDIFISNDWAANMGMATTDQLKEFYKQFPGQSATSTMREAGIGGWNGSAAAQALGQGNFQQPAPAARPPFSNSNAAAPFRTPYGLNGGAPLPGPQPPVAQSQGATIPGTLGPNAVPPRPVSQNQGPTIPQRPAPGQFGQFGGTFGGNIAPAASNSQAQPRSPYPGANAQNANAFNAANPNNAAVQGGAINNALTGQLPDTAKTPGGKQPYNPIQYYTAWPANLPVSERALNTPPELAYAMAPMVNKAIEAMAYSFGNPKMASITPTQIDLLVQAGLIEEGSDVEREALKLAGGPPAAGELPSNDLNLEAEGTGSWEPFNLGGGSMPTQMPAGRPGGGGGGGGSRNPNNSRGYGASLGMTQWRGL